jgi:hypothetical protein
LRVRAGIAALGVLGVAAAAAGLVADGPDFRSNVTLVKVDAYVYDRKTGAAIHDLQARDFVIYDNGEPRDIAYFGKESGPVDLVLLLDVSGTMREVLPEVADQASGALAALDKDDRAAVMAFGKSLGVTQDLTSEMPAVVKGIRFAPRALVGLDTDINQAVWGAADYLRRAQGTSRRAILIMTDNIQVTRVPDTLVEEQLYEAAAVVDGYLVRGRLPLPHIVHTGVLRFARATGGEVIEGSRPGERLREMIERIKSRYSIHFRPVETTSDAPRKIRVDLSPEARERYPNAAVRARTRYFPHSTPKPKIDIPSGQKVG